MTPKPDNTPFENIGCTCRSFDKFAKVTDHRAPIVDTFTGLPLPAHFTWKPVKRSPGNE